MECLNGIVDVVVDKVAVDDDVASNKFGSNMVLLDVLEGLVDLGKVSLGSVDGLANGQALLNKCFDGQESKSKSTDRWNELIHDVSVVVRLFE